MKINSRHYVLVIFAISAAVVSILGYIFMYRTIITQAKSSSKFLADINAESEKRQHEDELTKIYNNTVEDRTKIAQFFIHEDKIVDFIEKIEQIGRDSATDIDISSINTENSTVSAHIKAGGSWENIMRALIMIENLPYSISINNVRTSVSAEHKWDLSLEIVVLSIR